MQKTTGIALRKLEWPELPRVDLTTEFHWLIHDDTTAAQHGDKTHGGDNADVQDRGADAPDEELQYCVSQVSDLDRSPYRQLLNQPKEKRPPLSVAQRAAKKILKLKLELGCLDDEHGLSVYSQHQLLLDDPLDQNSAFRNEVQDYQPKKSKKPASEVVVPRDNAVLVSPNSPTTKANSREPRPRQPTTASATRDSPMSRSTANSALILKPPSGSSATTGKKKVRPESKEKHELRELHAKQQRLADWLSGDNAKEQRLGKKSREGDIDKHVAYSIEVESRIHTAMESNRDKGLWGDPVASLIADEMKSESVFGGFIPTRRLAFPSLPDSSPKHMNQPSEGFNSISKVLQQGSGASDDRLSEYPANSEDLGDTDKGSDRIEIPEDANNSLIHERALEIRAEAQSLVLAGNVEDALATLQSGIKQLLFDFQDNQDEIQARGFDFSQDAHNKATQVQLRYKARHRKRVERIKYLQRVWRNYQVKRAFLDTKAYRNLNAKVIQRRYKTRYFQLCRTRAATRIQSCFRVFQEQKLYIYLHRACRLLVNKERKKREKIRRHQVLRKRLWAKLSSILKLLWLWKSRFRALTRIQSHWKGSLARVGYATLLAVRCEAEQKRLARELQFVQPRLDKAMVLYSKFLRETSVGGELVHWQMNKPWLRFKRLRQGDWGELELRVKIRALSDVLILNLRGQLSARLLRVLGLLLGINATKVLTVQKPMHDASVESMVALYEAQLMMPPHPIGDIEHSASDAIPVLSRRSRRSRATKWLRKRQVQWKQWLQSEIFRLSCSLLLLYWHAVLWPLSCVFTRRSATNKQRALSALEKQQRFALTKHLQYTFRQLDATISGSKDRPSFACQYCFEAFATAHAWNLHLRECKREHNRELVEWDAVRSDVAFLSQQNPQMPMPSLLLYASTPLEFYRSFSTFELESEFAQQLRTERWWSSRKRALKILASMAVCCGVSTDAVDNLEVTDLGLQGDDQHQRVALALIAYLLLPLHPPSGLHPLVASQLHAFVDWAQPSTSSSTSPIQWISEKELFTSLLLSKSRHRLCSRLGRFVDTTAHTLSFGWQRAKTWAFSSFFSSSVSSLKYQGTGASAAVLPEA